MIRIRCGNCAKALLSIPDKTIDLVVTSPPYDSLRDYKGSVQHFSWEIFCSIVTELYRVLKVGGVVVWVVNDATINGSESLTSFKQAIRFREEGFLLYDTMIYAKSGLTLNHRRYEQEFEYMFVFTKGRPKTFNPIKVKCKYPEKEGSRAGQRYSKTDEVHRKSRSGKTRNPVKSTKIKGNIWYYPTGYNHSTRDRYAFEHPAIFPEQLAIDHILSWTDEGDTVLDPMMGSGTVGKCAKGLDRNFYGIEVEPSYFAIAKKRISEQEKGGLL